MYKLWSYLSINYKNSKIKVKLFISITSIMVVTLILVLAGLQYTFSFYDEQMYAKSSQVLMISSNSIEEKLKRIEEVSFNIATDPQIQRNLAELKGDVNEYDLYRIEQEIENQLAAYVGSEKFIPSITIFDAKGREFLGGSSSYPINKTDKHKFLQKASKLNGENYWIERDGSNRLLTSVRQIRSYENLSFENLGKLFIRVDLDRIVKNLPKTEGEIAGNIVISKGDQIIYSEKVIESFKDIMFFRKGHQGYAIENINGERFFINYIQSPFEDWTYWSVIPYDVMFEKITAAKFTLIVMFLLMFTNLIYLGFKFSERIINPIENLASVMQRVQKGNFKVVDSLNTSLIHEDEVGILYRNFKTMIEKIDVLIKENYSKQLLLKETEFKALQAQINPHFLYNTLESINWEAKANQQHQISKMVEALGYLLRHSINFKEDIITLENELEIVQNYITIQQYRFEERLEFQMDIPSELKHCRIPKLTLQPLIENAIHHALEPSLETCVIKIRARQESGSLFIRVEDNGPGIEQQMLEKVRNGTVKTKGNGIGIKNIHERITLGFGEEYGLKIENRSDKGTAVTVVLPIESGWLDDLQSHIG